MVFCIGYLYIADSVPSFVIKDNSRIHFVYKKYASRNYYYTLFLLHMSNVNAIRLLLILKVEFFYVYAAQQNALCERLAGPFLILIIVNLFNNTP